MLDKYQYIRKYCDFQTKDGIWRLGIIDGKFNKDKEIIEVALDGWSNNKIQVLFLIILESLHTF